MTMQITPLRLVMPVGFQPVQGSVNSGQEKGPASVANSFASVLERAVAAVQAKQDQANQAALQVAQGNLDDLHDAVLAQEEASLALDLTVQVRNKVLEAYQEIMRMPV